MKSVASWAVCEPGERWAPLNPSVTATETDSGYRIDGAKDRVEAGAQSAALLVVARCGTDPPRFVSFWFRRTRRAYASSRSSRSIWSSNTPGCTSTVSWCDGPRPSAPPTRRAALIERQSQIAQVLQCAEVVGILETVFDLTVQWALDRHTFGRPLASYQALKHKFADMKLWLEACRATTSAAVADVAARAAGSRACRPASPSPTSARWRTDRAGLRADARRHRRHLGTRPAPVPASDHVVPRHVRHAGGTQPARLRSSRRRVVRRNDRAIR